MSLEKNLKISRLFDEYSAVLSENQKLVMTEYYFEDKTLSEIAQNLSISRQAVLDTIKKSEDKLFEFEDKFKLVEKVECLQEIINKFKTRLPARFDLASGDCKMECVVFDIDDKMGKCVSAESLRIE